MCDPHHPLWRAWVQASIALRTARSKALLEYTRLRDVIAAATNDAMWTQTITLAVREAEQVAAVTRVQEAEMVAAVTRARAKDEASRAAQREARHHVRQLAVQQAGQGGEVTSESFSGYGDCCGGPSEVEGPDDRLWDRIKRTPKLQTMFERYAFDDYRSWFSAQVRPPTRAQHPRTDSDSLRPLLTVLAQCMAYGEGGCGRGCSVRWVDYFTHEETFKFCERGQICMYGHTENTCQDVTECPSREMVLATAQAVCRAHLMLSCAATCDPPPPPSPCNYHHHHHVAGALRRMGGPD